MPVRDRNDMLIRWRWLRLIGYTILLCSALVRSPSASPPFAAEMERLAEILGSLQFLTELCEDEPAPWRDEMEALIALAEPDEVWRLRLIDRFNLGYSSFAIVYRLCTAAAALAITHYRDEGADIAVGIAARFGAAAAPVALSLEADR